MIRFINYWKYTRKLKKNLDPLTQISVHGYLCGNKVKLWKLVCNSLSFPGEWGVLDTLNLHIILVGYKKNVIYFIWRRD